MALSISNLLIPSSLNDKLVAIGTVAFDSSYPTGGESLKPEQFRLERTDSVIIQAKDGYIFEYDYTNEKLKAYNASGTPAISNENAHTHAVALDGGASGAENAHTHAIALDSGSSAGGSSHAHSPIGASIEPPPLIVEEALAVASDTGTLGFSPLYIVAIHVTAGGVTGNFKLIPAGETPVSGQAALNFTTKVMTFLAADAVTAALITYIPQRATGYLSSVTVDESVVAAAAKTNLAARAGLVQYVWDDTDGVLVEFEQPGTAPSATHLCTIDINDAGNSSVDSHGADEGNALKVTYVPYSQIPPGCFIDDTDITLNAEAWNFTGDPLTNGYHNLIVPGFGVNLIGETGAAARSAAFWEGPSGTAADSVCTWNPATNSILTNQTVAMTIASIPWMILDTAQLRPFPPTVSLTADTSHTHGPGTLADAASGAGSSHTHGAGTLADAASAAGSSHTHTATAEAATEVGNGTNLSTLTGVIVIMIGN